VDDEAAVAEEGADALLRRRIQVHVLGREGVRGDLAVLAGQVADLAGLGQGGVAGRGLAADERVQMPESLGAVAVGRDRSCVDVVDCHPSVVSAMTMISYTTKGNQDGRKRG
jgi:hypothetical protein